MLRRCLNSLRYKKKININDLTLRNINENVMVISNKVKAINDIHDIDLNKIYNSELDIKYRDRIKINIKNNDFENAERNLLILGKIKYLKDEYELQTAIVSLITLIVLSPLCLGMMFALI